MARKRNLSGTADYLSVSRKNFFETDFFYLRSEASTVRDLSRPVTDNTGPRQEQNQNAGGELAVHTQPRRL